MKLLILVLSLIVIASAAPQRYRTTEVEGPQSDFDPSDIASFVIRSLASQRNPSAGRQQGGGAGNLLRILISLVANELGLSNVDGRADGIDQEIIIRNLIRTFTNIVGNVLLS